MFIYESTNYKTLKTDSITGKNVIEFCASMLNYSNDADEDDEKEYYVRFYDSDGGILNELTESGLLYAISGQDETDSDEIKEESQKFWEMIHDKVKMIKFENPIRTGDVIWNENYVENDDSESEVEENDNINQEKQA
jgi:hypothetical protein